jgi:hypothetical protein
MYSVIVPWANRPELAVTLTANRRLIEQHGAEVIVINAGGNCNDAVSIAQNAGVSRTRVLDLPGVTFNRSLCLNVGTMASRTDYVFCLDADIILHADVFGDAKAQGHLDSGYVLPRTLEESDPPPAHADRGPSWAFLAELKVTKEFVTTDGRCARLTTRMTHGLHSCDGVVMLAKRAACDVGGWNAALTGWGFEDTDFLMRLQFMLGLRPAEIGRAVHLTHSSAGRDQAAWQRNMMAANSNYQRGHYLGTFEADRMAWQDRYVEACAT